MKFANIFFVSSLRLHFVDQWFPLIRVYPRTLGSPVGCTPRGRGLVCGIRYIFKVVCTVLFTYPLGSIKGAQPKESHFLEQIFFIHA